ncbi:hypothetical protein E4T81_14150 [Barnesiella sp. WM24]|uniref:hypothetical protein n=1 Tax=Barnesiella sp. WM24 TaxID=2558278 RepID=UPI0010728BA4|nr:hypothetical protein [Barnesiella sp. WM24]TFU91916.1 hypothetical protein E4T81_14150 [Barnesiella sp. WM24]
MKRNARKIFMLIVSFASLFCFIALDYEGRFYGIQSFIFNNNYLPNKNSFETDEYEEFRVLDIDGFRIAGPGFRMNGSNNKIMLIEKYAIYDSAIYIQCQTENGMTEDYCLNASNNDSIENKNLFQLIPHKEDLPWRTNLIQKYKHFKVLKIISLCILTILIPLYSISKWNKRYRKSM